MYPASHPASTAALASITTASARARIAAEGAKVSIHGLAGRLDRGRVLQLEQPMIQAAVGEQLLVGAALAQCAVAQHQDAVGALDGGEAMAEHQRSAVLEQLVERALDQRFGFAVDAGGGL